MTAPTCSANVGAEPCTADAVGRYTKGPRCAEHTPAAENGRAEIVPDPAATLAGLRAAAGVDPRAPMTPAGQTLVDQRAVASGKRRSSPTTYRAAVAAVNGDQTMRALTIRQPWAWAVAAGAKTIENRTKATSLRGWFAVHAATQYADDAAFSRVNYLTGGHHPTQAELALGSVIAVARLVDTHPSTGHSCCGSDWADPMAGHHWVIDSARPLRTPVPATGKLGVWTLPADVAELVEMQTGALS